LWLKSFSSPESDLIPEQEAVAFLKKKDIELTEQLIRDFPNSEVPLVLMGNLHWRRGNSAEAVIFWEKSLEINPRRHDVYHNMGRAAFGEEKVEEAITLWKKALEIAPKVSGQHTNIAKALMRVGKYREAIAEAEEEIKLSPKYTRSYHLIGQGYLQLKEYDKAQKYYERVIELEPNHPHANYELAGMYMRLKQRDKAREHMAIYKKWKAAKDITYRIDSVDYGFALYSEGLTTLWEYADKFYQARGQMRKIEALFKDIEIILQKVISLVPKQPKVYQNLALFYLKVNRKLPEAQKLAAKAVALEATAANYFILCRCCYRNSDLANALSAIEKAVDLEPENPGYRQMYELIKRRSKKR
jgi:tetratricopeptide (TPR) repeat protein